jgi:hypothetical protein
VTIPTKEALIAILAESHEAPLGLSDSDNASLLTMAVQIFDVPATTEN